MTHAWRIRTPRNLDQMVRAGSGSCMPLGLLPILPADEMCQLLTQELLANGFRVDNKQLHRQEDGVQIEVDLQTDSITLNAVHNIEHRIATFAHCIQRLQHVINRVTATALKRKAVQLGEIKQLTEDESTGNLTIVLEV